ncbi:MAG: L-ascorbate metabolism protein UlaG (beta-lactamase superfamily) [Bradymonadia bacterium]
MTLDVRFHGHACFSLERAGKRLVLDPFEPGSLGGAVQLPALPDHFDAVLCTHEHADHAARHAVPSAADIGGRAEFAGIGITSHAVFHDEHGGSLRGGTSNMLRLRSPEGTVLHCGDLGERPTSAALEWLRAVPIDVLLVPVGGYFTLGADGAAELVSLLNPRVVVPCHSADDGVALAQLSRRAPFTARYASADVATLNALTLPIDDAVAGVVVLRRIRSTP